MQPARLPAGWIGRVGPFSRNLVAVCAATVGGIVIGGVSVLGATDYIRRITCHVAGASGDADAATDAGAGSGQDLA